MSLKRMSGKKSPAPSKPSSAALASKTKAERLEETISGLEGLIDEQEKFSDETREKLAEFLGTRIVAGEAEREAENERESQKESEREVQRQTTAKGMSRGGFIVTPL